MCRSTRCQNPNARIGAARGRALEHLIGEHLKNLLPSVERLLSAKWTDPDTGRQYETDAICLIDGVAIIFEAKGDALSAKGRRGSQSWFDDLDDIVVKATEQASIYLVASAGEQPALAWDFVRANFDTLSARRGPPFRDTFVAGLMTNFTDRAHAAELAGFAPAHQSSGGRIAAARAEEATAAEADFAERVLPAIEDWITARTQ
jgi:hypothetical protein